MTEPRSMEEWQLQNTSEAAEQWQLLDTEQQLPFEMQLQGGPATEGATRATAASPVPNQGWQPVEYAETEHKTSGGWLLPTLIIFALVAAVGYIGWLGWTGLDFGSTGAAVAPSVSEPEVSASEAAAPEEAMSDDTAVVAIEPLAEESQPEAATESPAVAEIAEAEPVAEPAPTEELVDQAFATIASQYGLNARSAPNTDGDVVVLLDDGATYAVVDQGVEGWVQLQLDDGALVWVSADFVELSSQLIPAEAAVNSTADQTAGVSSAPSSVVPPEPFTNEIVTQPSIVVDAEVGVNARADTSTDSDILQTLPQGAALGVVGKSEDGEWLQVALPNRDAAWVSAEAVRIVGALDSVSTPPTVASLEDADDSGADAPLGATSAISETAPAEAVAEEPEGEPAADVAADAEPEAAVEEEALPLVEQANATVRSSIGTTTRVAPSSDAERGDFISGGSVVNVTGRSEDGEWLQVTPESGDQFWIFAANMQLDVEISQLPVVEP